jgi:ribosomal protein S18 acetylase RimI-like enzyme
MEEHLLAYILTLCVNPQYRRRGLGKYFAELIDLRLAAMLITRLVSTVSTISSCKALYLHVLSTNFPAISFYERMKFDKLKLLRVNKLSWFDLMQGYYFIDLKWCDSYLYVKYINGGRPPTWSFE